MAQSPCFLLPLADSSFTSLPFPFTYLETLLGVIGSCPPWSQVTLKLTSPFSTPPHSKFPVSQVNCAPYYDDIMIPASHGPEHVHCFIHQAYNRRHQCFSHQAYSRQHQCFSHQTYNSRHQYFSHQATTVDISASVTSIQQTAPVLQSLGKQQTTSVLQSPDIQ
jgi:hypothetical protein